MRTASFFRERMKKDGAICTVDQEVRSAIAYRIAQLGENKTASRFQFFGRSVNAAEDFLIQRKPVLKCVAGSAHRHDRFAGSGNIS
jgi:hypothetical protein